MAFRSVQLFYLIMICRITYCASVGSINIEVIYLLHGFDIYVSPCHAKLDERCKKAMFQKCKIMFFHLRWDFKVIWCFCVICRLKLISTTHYYHHLITEINLLSSLEKYSFCNPIFHCHFFIPLPALPNSNSTSPAICVFINVTHIIACVYSVLGCTC